MKIKVKKVIHGIWRERKLMPNHFKNLPLRLPVVGKYQYLYSNEKNTISLIRMNVNIFGNRAHHWEICGGGLESPSSYDTTKNRVIIEKVLQEHGEGN